MTVFLSPVWGAGAQLLDNNGQVLSGGKIYTYLAGTTTPAVTYTDSSGNTSNTNPIILDSSGRVPYEIWFAAQTQYKFVLKDSDDVLIATYDNLLGVNSVTVTDASQITYTYPAPGGVEQTVEERLAQYASVKDFGAVGDGLTDDTTAIQTAIDSGQPIFFPAGTYVVTLSQTIALAGGTTVCSLIAQNGMVLKGAGWSQSIIKLKNNESTDAFPKYFNIIATNQHLDGVIIDGLCFDINGQNNPISPERGSGVYNGYNCAAFMCSGSVATVGQDAYLTNAKFTNNLIKNSPGVTCIGLAQSNQVGTVLGSNIEIAGNIFYNNGIDSNDHSTIYSWADNVDIHDNTFSFPTMSTGQGGPVVACELHGARNFFRGNDVYNYVQGLWIAGNYTSLSYNQIISDNSFVVSTMSMGIFVETSTEPGVQRIQIDNNSIWITDDNHVVGQQKNAIGLNPSYGAVDINVTNNYIYTTDTYASRGIYGICLASGKSLTNVYISDNQIVNFPVGVQFGGTIGVAGTTGNVFIEDNLIYVKKDTTHPTYTIGIYVDGINGFYRLCNNHITAGTYTDIYYGIYLPSTLQLDQLYNAENSFINFITVPILDDCVVLGQRSGTQALTFSVLPDQSTWVIGDVAYTLNTTEFGLAGSKYLLKGWTRITNGTANVLNTDWLENRVLTGN
jgi:hypothetical protein